MILYTCVHGFQSRHVASLSSECTPQGSTLMHMQVDRIKCMGFRIYTPPLDAKSQNFICHVPLSYVQGTIQDQGWQSLLLHLNLYKSFYIWTGCPFLPFSTPVQCIGRHQTRLEHFQLAGQVPNSSRLSSRLILIHFKKKETSAKRSVQICTFAKLPVVDFLPSQDWGTQDRLIKKFPEQSKFQGYRLHVYTAHRPDVMLITGLMASS